MSRSRKYTQTEVDAAVRRVVEQNVRLVQENERLVRAVEYRDGLLDTAYTRMETLARETGRMDALGSHPSLRSGESVQVPPARSHLRLIEPSPVTSTEGKQT